MRFPSREQLAVLSEAEFEALASLHFAMTEVRHEWGTSRAALDRLFALSDHAEHLDDGARFTFRSQALDGVRRAAYRYTDAVERAMWPCVSAYTVLGIAVLERVVDGKARLTDQVVAELAEEPTLGQLHAALSVPVVALLAARDAQSIKSAQQRREQLLARVEGIYESLADPMLPSPLNREQAAVSWLTEAQPEGTDALWEGLLEPLVLLAGQTPSDVAFHLRQRG
ncbi:hypothetical protein ACIRS1_25455 [Kitasatospora sp. NPDC101176]|uniref:hypothetical protein n=1 Tax=Kitasatospora sp. NPDC101176 TaxID=3364099 RepID=UPI00382D16D3